MMNKKKVLNNQNGITLVALVVTIVILIILATVAINAIFGDNGLITSANKAKLEQEKAEARERLSLVLADAYTEKITNKEEYDKNQFLNDFIEAREPDAYIEGPESNEISLNGHTFELNREVPELGDYLGEAGNLPARISKIEYEVNEEGKTISVTVSAVRIEKVENPEYKYYIKEENGEYIEKTTQAGNTYEFSDLEEKNYIIKVELVGEVNENYPEGLTTYKETGVIALGEKFSEIYKTTTKYTDSEGNVAWIPGGFAVGEDEDINKVSGGLVIKDANGNQFVWIPVGTYKVSNKLSETGTLTNNLSRRTFTSSGATEVSGDNVIETYYYGEGDSRSIANGTIGAFKTSVSNRGGFYIGRYEQGTGNVCKAGVEPYVNVTRDTANTQAKAMYSGNEFVTSELISSYAWDTALNFVCQTNTAGYTLATTTSSTYGNINTKNPTKTGVYTADKYSNICDFLGNRREWTTEYCSFSYSPCIYRGGDYDGSSNYAAVRHGDVAASDSSVSISFRPQLYVN